MATRVHRPLKVVTFNANEMRGCREIREQLLYPHTDMTRFSQTYLKPSFQITIFIQRNITKTEKAELSMQLEKASPTAM
jgi:hypothetical protein